MGIMGKMLKLVDTFLWLLVDFFQIILGKSFTNRSPSYAFYMSTLYRKQLLLIYSEAQFVI